jgi:eukaryotic-like serine/threonine-protein kinase
MTSIRLFDPERGFQRLERYELIGEIASGGMATIYLARLKGVGGFRRFFAVKCLLPHLAAQQDFVEMFLDEARLAAAIRHPNVVPILEIGTSSNGHFIVMEYVEGDSLAGFLERSLARGTVTPVPIVLRIALDMLAGLHAAHELVDENGRALSLVHRDVSPQNILVGVDGVARLTDFGIARATSRLSSTREGQLKGKLAYMAPEYVQGDDLIDRRADVFSAGIVIWEALATARLFKSDNEAATLARVVAATPPLLTQVAPHVSERVSRVVMRALQRERSARFATCAEFADALEGGGRGEVRPASSRELAAYVHRVMGDSVRSQRDDIRACVARLEKLSRESTVVEGRRHSVPKILALVSSMRAAPPEVTTTVSTTSDVKRSSRPVSTIAHLRPMSLTLLALGVLGFGGGVGAYFGVRASRVAGPPAAVVAAQPQASAGVVQAPVASIPSGDHVMISTKNWVELATANTPSGDVPLTGRRWVELSAPETMGGPSVSPRQNWVELSEPQVTVGSSVPTVRGAARSASKKVRPLAVSKVKPSRVEGPDSDSAPKNPYR